MFGKPQAQQQQDPIAVESTWVESIAYVGGNLIVKTKRRVLITFVGVPERLWQQLQASTSKGRFINAEIKGKYKEL